MLVPIGTALVHQPTAQSLIHICGVDRQSSGDQNKTPAHKLPSCPICQHLHLLGGGFVPPDAAVLVALSLPSIPVISTGHIFYLKFKLAATARPRAPPTLV